MADFGKAFVARLVAVMIVEALEMVDVEEGERNRLAIADGAVPFPLQRFVEGAAVAQPGQGIGRRQPFEFVTRPV